MIIFHIITNVHYKELLYFRTRNFWVRDPNGLLERLVDEPFFVFRFGIHIRPKHRIVIPTSPNQTTKLYISYQIKISTPTWTRTRNRTLEEFGYFPLTMGAYFFYPFNTTKLGDFFQKSKFILLQFEVFPKVCQFGSYPSLRWGLDFLLHQSLRI